MSNALKLHLQFLAVQPIVCRHDQPVIRSSKSSVVAVQSTVTCHAPLPRLLSNGVSRCEIASLHCALLLLSLSLLLLLLIGYLCWIRCSRAPSLTSLRRVVSRQYNNNNNNCKLASSPSCQAALALDNLEIYWEIFYLTAEQSYRTLLCTSWTLSLLPSHFIMLFVRFSKLHCVKSRLFTTCSMSINPGKLKLKFA